MNGSKMLAKGALVGMIIGAASAVSLQAAHAEETLPGPLSGSDTALILGGTTEPTPSNAFARAAENLFLHPLGFDDGATSSTVCDMIVTNPCAAPLQVLTTPGTDPAGPEQPDRRPTTSRWPSRTNSTRTRAFSAPTTR